MLPGAEHNPGKLYHWGGEANVIIGARAAVSTPACELREKGFASYESALECAGEQ